MFKYIIPLTAALISCKTMASESVESALRPTFYSFGDGKWSFNKLFQRPRNNVSFADRNYISFPLTIDDSINLETLQGTTGVEFNAGDRIYFCIWMSKPLKSLPENQAIELPKAFDRTLTLRDFLKLKASSASEKASELNKESINIADLKLLSLVELSAEETKENLLSKLDKAKKAKKVVAVKVRQEREKRAFLERDIETQTRLEKELDELEDNARELSLGITAFKTQPIFDQETYPSQRSEYLGELKTHVRKISTLVENKKREIEMLQNALKKNTESRQQIDVLRQSIEELDGKQPDVELNALDEHADLAEVRKDNTFLLQEIARLKALKIKLEKQAAEKAEKSNSKDKKEEDEVTEAIIEEK